MTIGPTTDWHELTSSNEDLEARFELDLGQQFGHLSRVMNCIFFGCPLFRSGRLIVHDELMNELEGDDYASMSAVRLLIRALGGDPLWAAEDFALAYDEHALGEAAALSLISVAIGREMCVRTGGGATLSIDHHRRLRISGGSVDGLLPLQDMLAELVSKARPD